MVSFFKESGEKDNKEMSTRKSFFKFLELLFKEDERAKVFKEYIEEKSGYSVFVEKIGLPGLTDYFELNNVKLKSPDNQVRINFEMIRLLSTQLSSLAAAGKILVNSDAGIPLESLGSYGIYISYGPEDKPSFELYAGEALFEGSGFKIKYDSNTQEPEFTGTLSATSVTAEISISNKNVEIPPTKGTMDITFNLKTLSGNAHIDLVGNKVPGKTENGQSKKEMRKEKLSIDSASLSFDLHFTLLPYSV